MRLEGRKEDRKIWIAAFTVFLFECMRMTYLHICCDLEAQVHQKHSLACFPLLYLSLENCARTVGNRNYKTRTGVITYRCYGTRKRRSPSRTFLVNIRCDFCDPQNTEPRRHCTEH
jgi:hypothetical protein